MANIAADKQIMNRAVDDGLSLFLRVCLPIQLLLLAGVEWRAHRFLLHTYDEGLIKAIIWGLPALLLTLLAVELAQSRMWAERYASFWRMITVETCAIVVLTSLTYKP